MKVAILTLISNIRSSGELATSFTLLSFLGGVTTFLLFVVGFRALYFSVLGLTGVDVSNVFSNANGARRANLQGTDWQTRNMSNACGACGA